MTNSNADYYSSLSRLANLAKRFCDEPDKAAEKKQLEDRFRVLKEAGSFDEFKPTSEKELEDWMDVTARKVKARRLCVPLFREQWCACTSESIGYYYHECGGEYIRRSYESC
eukprot:GHVQ01038322.1.p1 GENE.GHVQ01038322.1~~GHVQ01038322.1.p1  ORF type:complete len:112 (-),score=10.16 GHVQ01038322.1:600-935(-)